MSKIPANIAEYIRQTRKALVVCNDAPPEVLPAIESYLATVQAATPEIAIQRVDGDTYRRITQGPGAAGPQVVDFNSLSNTDQARRILEDVVALYKRGKEVSDIYLVSRDAGVHEVQFEIFSNKTTSRRLSAAGILAIQDGFWNIATTSKEYSNATRNQNDFAFFTYSGPLLPDEIFSIRGQFANTVGDGCTLVIRVTYKTSGGAVRQLHELNFDTETVEALTDVARLGTGGIVLAGEIGNGKTMSAYALIYADYLYRKSLGIESAFYSREQPPERIVPWMDQITIKRDEDWGPAGKALLRMALKVELIGEIRGPEDAQSFADHAAIFKAYATFHGADALSTLIRFYQMGVPDYQLTNPQIFSVIAAQRLLPILCPHCSDPWAGHPDAEPRLSETLKHVGLFHHARRRGTQRRLACTTCEDGSIGKRPIIEIFRNDGETAEEILKHPVAGRRHWVQQGVTTMGMQALRLVRDGLVDPRFVERLMPMRGALRDFEVTGKSLFDGAALMPIAAVGE